MFFVLFVFIAAASYTAPLPDTGQTRFFHNHYVVTCWLWMGQDANYTINLCSYTDLGNGTVLDNVTGLEWVQDDNLMGTRDPEFDTDGPACNGDVAKFIRR